MTILSAPTAGSTRRRHPPVHDVFALVLAIVIATVLGLLSTIAAAQTPLRIDITGVGQRQIPVAVAPFDETDQTQRYGRIVTEVIRADLARSGVISIADAGTPSPVLNERSELAPLLPPGDREGPRHWSSAAA